MNDTDNATNTISMNNTTNNIARTIRNAINANVSAKIDLMDDLSRSQAFKDAVEDTVMRLAHCTIPAIIASGSQCLTYTYDIFLRQQTANMPKWLGQTHVSAVTLMHEMLVREVQKIIDPEATSILLELDPNDKMTLHITLPSLKLREPA